MTRLQTNPAFWQGKRVLLTGHTGFKGSWLSLWLQSMGATIRGVALTPPTDPALFNVARVADGMDHQIADIRDYAARPVQWIVEHLCENWGHGASWTLQPGDHPHEANFLKLDISKARQRLQWTPRWSLETALTRITEWHQAWLANQDMRTFCLQQISQYQADV